MIWLLWSGWLIVLVGVTVGVLQQLSRSRVHLLPLLVLVALAGSVRGLGSPDLFFGLEYEDAYVYAEASRNLRDSRPFSGVNSVAVCSIGTLEYCEAWEAYPGHLLGFPALLNAVQQLVPFEPRLVTTVAATLSAAATAAVWWVGFLLYNSHLVAFLSALLFAVTPVLCLYGGSGCSEAASAILFCAAIGGAVRVERASNLGSIAGWSALACSASVVAAATRRENLLVLVGLVALLWWSSALRGYPRFRALALFLVSLATAWFTWSAIHSARLEVGEYGEVSFSIARFINVIGAVGTAVSSFEWFGLIALTFVIGVVILVRKRASLPAESFRALLLSSLFVIAACFLYASHVRSTYQLAGEPIVAFDFLRYLSNLGAPLCIVAGNALKPLASVRDLRMRVAVGLSVLAYAVVNIIGAIGLRSELIESEQSARIQPALVALSIARAEDKALVTLEPLVARIFASNSSTKIFDLAALPSDMNPKDGVFLLQDHYSSRVDAQRYRHGLALTPPSGAEKVLRVGAGWRVVSWSAGSFNPSVNEGTAVKNPDEEEALLKQR